ncbi:PIN domain-like protein [Mycena olivaceomarginata]|nr:PIN domain-like protein [Mycena olivaceomarginata]
MGIDNLYKELEVIAQKISLPSLVVQTGFLGNTTGLRGFRLGIDASGWIYRACRRHGSLESPELVALFSRCSRLFRLPFIPIFVFDGPECPRIKRGRVIGTKEHWLTGSFQQMLDGFGFDWITGCSSASALFSTEYLSVWMLYSRMTPTPLFLVATDVLRIRSEDNEKYEASYYSASDISTVLGLSREDFILIAILAGGDYSNGLAKCGITIAVGLTRAGLGPAVTYLCYSAETQSQIQLLPASRAHSAYSLPCVPYTVDAISICESTVVQRIIRGLKRFHGEKERSQSPGPSYSPSSHSSDPASFPATQPSTLPTASLRCCSPSLVVTTPCPA